MDDKSGQNQPLGIRRLPRWALVAGIVLAVPMHFVAWSWFAEAGPELIRNLATAVAPSPSWLTSIFYFPIALVALALTEFVAILPLNLIAVVFGLRQGTLRSSRRLLL